MADAGAVLQSASVIARSREPGKAILVIPSAMSGVTDQLNSVVQAAVT